MKRVRRIKVMAVRERSLSVKKRSLARQGLNERCPEHGPMVSPDLAAAFSLQTTRTIYRWVEEGKLHYAEGPGGLLVCLLSLPTNQD